SDQNSLSLFIRRSGYWQDRGFLLHGGQRPIHHPTILSHGVVATLAWIEDDEASHVRRARAARLQPDGTLGEVVLLGEAVEDLVAVYGDIDVFRWIASAVSSRGDRILRLLE